MADGSATEKPQVTLPDLTKRVRVLTIADVEKVKQELLGVAEKWHEIGTALKLSVIFLRELKKEERGAKESLHVVVKEWLGGNSPCPTWGLLIEILKKDTVEEEALSNRLSEKYPPGSEFAPDDASGEVGCGIENCICERQVSSLLEKFSGLAFPYLELSDEAIAEGCITEELRRKLQLEHHEVVAHCDSFYSYTWRAINRKNATPEKLVTYLEKTELFQSFHRIPLPVIPLFTHLKPAFTAAKTLEEIFLILRHHMAHFSHSVMVDILLNLGGSARDRRSLDNFRDQYYSYMRRKAPLFPCLYGAPSKSLYALVHFTLKKDITKISLTEVDSFSNRLTYNLSISRFSMKLVGLVRKKEGYVDYIYQIPSYARNFVFPLSDEQTHSMRMETITGIACCSYNLIIPEKAPEGVESVYGVTQMLHADDEQPPEEDMAMEVCEEPPPVPLYAILPPGSPFRIDGDQVNVPTNLKRLQERCRSTDNYAAIIPWNSSMTLYAAMVLCQHAAERKSKEERIKCVIVVNTKPRAHETMEEMGQFLPAVSFSLLTGSETDSIANELLLDRDVIVICTSGKFYHELESEAVKIASISLLIVDNCHNAMRQSPLEAALHKYVVDRVYRNLKPPLPQIVGITNNPTERSPALDEEALQKHLLKIAGGVDSAVGVLFTEDFKSDTYTPPLSDKILPKPMMQARKFMWRDPKKDIIAALQVELFKWEDSINICSPHLKWSAGYTNFIQSRLEDALASLDKEGVNAPPDLVERVRVLELLQCYAQATKACIEFGPESALAILQAPTQSSSMSTTRSLLTASQFNSLQRVREDIEWLMAQKNGIVETVLEMVCKRFTNPLQKSRGILFVDSFQDATYLSGEISKSYFRSRPIAVPRCLVASYSTEACTEVEKAEQISEGVLEKGREGLQAFAKGESRLLVIPYALESDLVEVENIESEFDFIARLHKLTRRDDFNEAEYVLSIVVSQENKPFTDLRRDFNMCRLELGLKTLPTGELLKKKLKRAQEDVMYSYQSRFVFPLSRMDKKKNEVHMDQIQLRCKKCKVMVCHGMELFSFFVDGGQHAVVPNRDFDSRYNTKPYLAKHRAIKRVNRLKKMFCSSCGSPWGVLCHFPAKGCQLPVIKSKHFIFEMNRKYYSIKIWSDALFKLPPLAAYPKFHIHGVDLD